MNIGIETTLGELRKEVLTAFDGGHLVYMTLLAERWRHAPDRDVLTDVYSSLLDLGDRLLQGVAAGDAEVAAWAWGVMQEQVPAVRERLGEDVPASYREFEEELRERYGIPEPSGAVAGFVG